MQELDELLAHHPFFQGLAPEDVRLLAGCGSNVHFDEGAYLFHEGDPSEHFYLIRHGRVAVEIASPGRGPVAIATVRPGELLGWSWLVPPYRKQFDARALEAVRATSFDGGCIRTKCEADPRLGYELLKRFAQIIGQRLQATRLQLLDVYGNRK